MLFSLKIRGTELIEVIEVMKVWILFRFLSDTDTHFYTELNDKAVIYHEVIQAQLDYHNLTLYHLYHLGHTSFSLITISYLGVDFILYNLRF